MANTIFPGFLESLMETTIHCWACGKRVQVGHECDEGAPTMEHCDKCPHKGACQIFGFCRGDRTMQEYVDEANRRRTTAAFHLNTEKTVAVAADVYFDEDMKNCPRGVKVQLLGAGGVAQYGIYTGDPFWIGWAPVPRRRPR